MKLCKSELVERMSLRNSGVAKSVNVARNPMVYGLRYLYIASVRKVVLITVRYSVLRLC